MILLSAASQFVVALGFFVLAGLTISVSSTPVWVRRFGVMFFVVSGIMHIELMVVILVASIESGFLVEPVHLVVHMAQGLGVVLFVGAMYRSFIRRGQWPYIAGE